MQHLVILICHILKCIYAISICNCISPYKVMSLQNAPYKKVYTLNGDLCCNKPNFCFYYQRCFAKPRIVVSNKKEIR